MNLFIFNLIALIQNHIPKQSPIRWWLDREENGSYKEIKILSDFNTIVFSSGSKDQVRARNHGKTVYVLNKHEAGVKVDPETGKVSMWEKTSTNRKGKEFYKKVNFHDFMSKVQRFGEPITDPGDDWAGVVHGRVYPALVDEFLAYHNAKSFANLIIPAAEAFGIVDKTESYNAEENGSTRTPWMDFALGARTLDEFWTRMGRTVKLAKDEKRALVALIKHDQKYMAFARMATRISIPNIRTLTVPQEQQVERTGLYGRQRAYTMGPWDYIVPNSDMVNKWMLGLRMVEPKRRVMFLQNWGQQATDTLSQLADLRKAGETELMNYRSVHEYHEAARIALRLIKTKNREIKEVQAKFYTPGIRQVGEDSFISLTDKRGVHGVMIGDIKVIAPHDTHTVISWGEMQHHCIGTYADEAVDGRTILLGFKRGDDWVGHASIERGRCTQLLGRFNERLPHADRMAILNWMVRVQLIDTADTRWG